MVTTNLDTLTLFKILSDETRLGILLLLKSQGELCVCELEAALKADQPKVSRHLALMRKASLLNTQKRGKWVYYDINPELAQWVNEVLMLTTENSTEKLASLEKGLRGFKDKDENITGCC